MHEAQLDEPVVVVYVLTEQALQLAAPGPENVPIAHSEQTVSVVAVHAVDANDPAVHRVHDAQLGVPIEAAYVPAAQALQLAAPGPEKVPTGHALQIVLDVALHAVDAKEPAPQDVQDVQGA